MITKSYVTMEKHQCIVCGRLYETGALLLNKRMKDSFEKYTTTGTGLCPEHQKLFDDEYIALIEVNNKQQGASLTLKNANRTGRIAHIHEATARQIFNTPIGTEPMMFVEIGRDGNGGVLDALESMQHPDDKH